MDPASARTVAVIPARGGSKGIPRKNLRPLGGRPLLRYAVRAALDTPGVDDVIVNTDDPEIALFARRFGARVQMRPAELADDAVPLDPVIAHTVAAYEAETGARAAVVLTIQPTSPLVSPDDIAAAVRRLDDSGADTVISAVPDRHLTWRRTEGGFRPNYAERVNRQYLPDDYRETGAIVACRAALLRERGTRIGERIELLVMPPERAIDIDTYQDWAVAEFLLRRRRVAFVVVGSRELGLGHAYRALMLAHELVEHELAFYCPEGSELAAELIGGRNYPVEVVPAAGVVARLADAPPDLVINDVLDTTADYVVGLKKLGCRVVNFEDLGLGAEVADRVYNALYPHQLPLPHIRVGPRYFCLRDEFLHGLEGAHAGAPDKVAQVLVTFGGVDEAGLTARVLEAVADACRHRGIRLDVVAGPGYARPAELEALAERLNAGGAEVAVTCAPGAMSEHMAAAQAAFCSGGRTVFELASLRVPTVVLCQNARETTHTFADADNGFINLGLGARVDPAEIRRTFERLVDDPVLRGAMAARMAAHDFRAGKAVVVGEIKELLAAPRPEARP